MSEIRVIKPGIFTTIQDLGRWGFQAQGVSVAGAMDPYSHRLANALARNPLDAATLEVTLGGPELEFSAECVIAVAGAEFEMTLDARPIPSHTALTAPAGSRLAFGRRVRGARAYIAVGGGFVVPTILGSRSTHVVSGMGGLDGRALRAGDRLPVGQTVHAQATPSAVTTRSAMPVPDGHARVRILPGFQRDDFALEAFRALQAAPYRVGRD